MSKLQHALKLAEMGFEIFPLKENSKLPLIKDFPNQATTDSDKIRAWWLDPVLEIERDYNIGISTSRFKDGALVVIDVDNKGTKKGSETLEELEILGSELPTTFHQLTPTGGEHLVFTHSEALKQGVNVLGNGLDIRSKGGYIVGFGSTLPEGVYTALENKIAPCPEWLTSRLGTVKEKSQVVVDLSNINQENAKERAIHYLKNEAPESVKGQGGDQTAYRVAAMVKDFGIDQDTCLELMLDHWFEGSGWTPEKLKAKIDHAYRYGKEAVGANAPEAQFTPVEESSEQEQSYLQKINNDHALVLIEGSYFVIHETVDEKGHPKRTYLSEQAFKRKFSPFVIQKRDTFATIWLDWKNRREYAGICFAPEREVNNNYYNLWRGFTVKPLPYEKASKDAQDGFDAWILHARKNICSGDENLFKWLMSYLAHMIQKPYERPLTTLVFKGSKGTGKNAVIDRVGYLIGEEHYHVVQDGRYLTSNFNGHMDSCLCLVLDEAIWSGDKSAEGILKGVTTSPTIMIERKGKEPYKVDNLMRLILISNEEWVVPASTDERRYAVFCIGEGNKQDRKFFEDMRINLDSKGGSSILLHFLKTYKIDADVNDAPKTSGLLEQKLNSLDPIDQWWFDCLESGEIVNSEYGGEWPESVDTGSFRSAAIRSVKERNIRSWNPTSVAFGKKMKKIAPSIAKTKRRDGDKTVWIYKMPTIETARNEWEAYLGQPVEWE